LIEEISEGINGDLLAQFEDVIVQRGDFVEDLKILMSKRVPSMG
jgi:hypothetical protein